MEPTTSRRILLTIFISLFLVGCYGSRKYGSREYGSRETVADQLSSQSEQTSEGETTVTGQTHSTDTTASVTSGATTQEESGVVEISRDSSGRPSKIVWRRAGEKKETVKRKETGDRWFAGLNATRQSEARQATDNKKSFGRTEIREQVMPSWKAFILPGLLILLGGLGWLFASKGEKK